MTKNTAWAFAGNTVYAASQWVVFVLLVKALSPQDAGTFAYATAVTGPIFVLTNVRLRNLLATGIDTAGGFTDYLVARVLTTIAAVLISLCAGAMMSPGLGSFAIVALMALGRACDALSDICHGLFQREFEMRRAAVGLLVNGVVSVTLVTFVLVVSRSLVTATAAYATGSLVALCAWDLPGAARRRPVERPTSRRDRTLRGSTAGAARLIVTALPLGLSSALGSVQASIPRYVITFSLGAASLAKFAAISYLPLVGHLIVNATSQAALPILANDARTSDLHYRTRLGLLVFGTIATGAATLLLTFRYGGLALTVIYGSDYASHSSVLFWLAAASVVTFASVFLGTGTTARRRFKSQLFISLASLVVVAACAPPFVREFGLIGASWALFAGAAVEFSAYGFLTIRDLTSPALAIPTIGPNPVAGGLTP
jgi:O-antigen/teichoic acid export membrane protein